MVKKPWIRAFILLMVASSVAAAATIKTIYKVSKLSPNVVAVSCPGNLADPAVIKSVDGVLLVSCGTYDPSVLTK